MTTSQPKQFFDEHGYYIERGLFSQDEVQFYIDHYMDMRAQGAHPGDYPVADPNSTDPLQKFPRMIHMHRWDDTSLDWMLDHRIAASLETLLAREAFATQTMLYFKPPGARGQALHQDQYYLRVQPGTCIAAWMALDRCDEENGCLRIVPGSQDWPLLCITKADITQSFSDKTVPIPEGTQVVSMIMDPGDVLFFNGQVVHGSEPNNSKDRFRRALIGHYIGGDAYQVASFYHPTLRMDGTEVELATSQGGGSCGVWVDQEGAPVIEMAGVEGLANRTE